MAEPSIAALLERIERLEKRAERAERAVFDITRFVELRRFLERGSFPEVVELTGEVAARRKAESDARLAIEAEEAEAARGRVAARTGAGL
jgi:hypothetical protein